MATGGAGTRSSPQGVTQPSHRGVPGPAPAAAATSPPSKGELSSWWKTWKKTAKKPDSKVEDASGIFGVPLAESIRYANVAISLSDDHGESFIYGYVPIVVAKCGVFLKEKATDVEGIFRLSGSAKRIKDLQIIFNSPDRYGKGLDWTGYTVHDAANILRRYLNQLPEPIVPLNFYERFREPLRPHLARSSEGEASFDLTMDQQSSVVARYQRLITELPPLNRQLLLYILDLLAVFSSKSDLNRMNAANLAAIFQPGILSHPQHDMAPTEYRLSQDVLIFLIENQDHFLFGMSGTGIDEKTKQDVESGVPSAKSPNSAIGRSASNASAGADSLRKYGVRRNVSVGSRGSRERSSPGVSSPGTPTGQSQLAASSAQSGIARSNTMPSKRSPAIASGRFQRMHDSTPTGSPVIADLPTPPDEFPVQDPVNEVEPPTPTPPAPQTEISTAPVPIAMPINTNAQQPAQRDRKISSLLARSPLFGPIDPQGKKLQKRRGIPGSANESAQSSQASLQGDEQVAFQTPLMSPELNSANRGDPMRATPAFINTAATPTNEHPTLSPTSAERANHAPRLQPQRSPAASIHSKSSVTDHSEFDNFDNHLDPNAPTSAPTTTEKEKKRSRWRFSSSAKKTEDFPLQPPPRIGENAGARGSNSSIGSAPGKPPRKSFTGDSQATTVASGQEGSSIGHPSVQHSSHDSSEALKDSTNNGEEKRGGLFGRFKANRKEKKEKEAEKERAKSPPRSTVDDGKGRASLNAIAHDHFGNNARGRGSFDKSRGGSTASESVPPPVAPAPLVKEEAAGTLETVTERPVTEGKENESMGGMATANVQQSIEALESTKPEQVTNAERPVTPALESSEPVSASTPAPAAAVGMLADRHEEPVSPKTMAP